MLYVEKEIIKGCIDGDRLSQRALYEKHSKKFYHISLRYAQDEEEAEDILQDGFIKIFKSIGSYSGNGSFEGWMRRIIVNTAIEYYRKRTNLYSLSDVENQDSIGLSENAIDRFGEEELLSIINSLPTGYRTVFNLYCIDGYTHKEIGDLLKISEGTSKSQLARARSILQEKVKELYSIQEKKMK